MFSQLKRWLETHEKEYELLRYAIAGGLTTLLSLAISYSCNFILAPKEPMTDGLFRWIVDTIDLASATDVLISNAISWVLAVLFAFWINRRMVFRVQGGTSDNIWCELGMFTLGRVASFLLFEQGMALLLKVLGVSNILNRIIVLLFVMVFNYVVSKFWVFKKNGTDSEEPQA